LHNGRGGLVCWKENRGWQTKGTLRIRNASKGKKGKGGAAIGGGHFNGGERERGKRGGSRTFRNGYLRNSGIDSTVPILKEACAGGFLNQRGGMCGGGGVGGGWWVGGGGENQKIREH